ncbi:hypothetical protein [Lacrimispora sp.]|uniref:hypothetical protein n=1 Tax=Lacrimispora sp. TaxID=2719234 RepID=UPI0039969AEB
MNELKKKIDSRTITKDEYTQYVWNKKMKEIRTTAVNDFWDMEVVRISEGTPTRPWSESQMAEIMSGKKPTFNGKALQGHHSYSVSKYPHLAGSHEIIWPATFKEHLNGWHGGNWRTSLPGKPIVEIDDLIVK